MNFLLELLYAPIQPLIWHPERAFIIAIVFLVLLVINAVINKGKIKYIWPLLLAVCSWLLFGLNEYIAYSNKIDIRIDLLFVGPAIIVISIFAIYSFIKNAFGRWWR